MNKDSKKFLYSLLETPSPTGYEVPIQKVVRKRMAQYADSIETDLHGNLIVAVNPKAERKIMLAGHCDQIGFMVQHITKEGYLYIAPLGGIDAGVMFGASVTIHTESGPIPGVIGRKPIHLQSQAERVKMSLDINKAWIDIGAKDEKAASKLVKIGDPVTYKLGVTELEQDLITSPGLDNRVGLFIVMEALRLASKSKLSWGLYSVSTVQEEVGLRGATTAAYGVDPEIGIAVDVTHANDNPGSGEGKSAPCHLGKGPTLSRGPNTNPVVANQLESIAKTKKIPFQYNPNAQLFGNDARAMQVTRAGVATAAIGVPNRYMHTQVEVCSLKDLENCAKLLAEFVKGLKPRSDFRPR